MQLELDANEIPAHLMKFFEPIQPLPAKNLQMIPARLAIALQGEGWIIRSDICWAKTAPMPESVTDRMTSAWEHIFMLTKQQRYYYDADAVRVPVSESFANDKRVGTERVPNFENAAQSFGAGTSASRRMARNAIGDISGRNLWNYWLLGPEPFSSGGDVDHFATMPTEIPRRAILAGSRPGDTVLDPFSGAGTTALVAARLNRDAISIELSPAYAEMSRKRIVDDCPLFADATLEYPAEKAIA